MKIELDVSRLKKAVEQTQKSLEFMEEENEKLTKKFITKATDNLKYIASSAIDKFYEDYEPRTYDRMYDLYHMYRVTVTKDEWHIDFDSAWSEEWHRVDEKDPEYIFENSLIHGWHGGAISGDGHPNPGTPYWRYPSDVIQLANGGTLFIYSRDSMWSPSLRSPSPYQEIVRKSKIYMDIETAKYHAEYNENIEKFRRSMQRNLERIR